MSESVEGLYQGLKVFEFSGIDTNKFSIRNGKNLIRRKVRKLGKFLGHLDPTLGATDSS